MFVSRFFSMSFTLSRFVFLVSSPLLSFAPSLPLFLSPALRLSLSFFLVLFMLRFVFLSLSLSPSIRLAPSPASLTPLHDFEHVAISVSALSRRQDMFVGRVRMLTNF